MGRAVLPHDSHLYLCLLSYVCRKALSDYGSDLPHYFTFVPSALMVQKASIYYIYALIPSFKVSIY